MKYLVHIGKKQNKSRYFLSGYLHELCEFRYNIMNFYKRRTHAVFYGRTSYH